MQNFKLNADAFSRLVSLCTQHGDSYKPSNPAIERTALLALLEEAQKSIAAVQRAEAELTKTISHRHEVFDKLPLVATRVGGLAAGCGFSATRLKDLNRIKKLFRSQPFRDDLPVTESTTPDASKESAKPTRFNRQMAFSTKAINFGTMIQMLETEAAYKPKEPEYSIDGLKAMLAELHAANEAVQQARITVQSARITRRQIIFGRETGIAGVAKLVKGYLKGILGYTSPEFQLVHSTKIKGK